MTQHRDETNLVTARERFTEFVTSGAFAISLTRNQVGQLGMLAQGAEVFGCASLFRKGLAEEARRPDIGPERTEYRISPQGLLVASLVAQAGLSNSPTDAQSAAVERLYSKIDALREQIVRMQESAQSAHARAFNTEQECERLRHELKAKTTECDGLKIGLRLKDEARNGVVLPRPPIRARDPLPDLSDAELETRIADDGRLPA